VSNVSSRVLSSEAPLTSTVEPTMTSSVLDCQLWNKKQVNCSSRLHSDPEQWRLGRNYLEQQIRTLRLQLDEMKIIRKHLRTIRPLAAKVHALDPKPHTRQPFFSRFIASEWPFVCDERHIDGGGGSNSG